MKKLGILIAITTLLMACEKEPIFNPGPTTGRPPVQNPPVGNPPVDNPPPGGGGNPPSNPPGNPGTTVASKIKLRTKMIIGGVIYDSIPGSLMIRSWDSTGQLFTAFYSLAAGTNTLELPVKRVKFNFRLTKWGSIDEMEILTKDIRMDSVYVLGAAKDAKKIKTEIVYKLVNDVYQPESKKEFSYHLNGWLDKVTHYGKRPDGTPTVNMTSRFSYIGQRLDRITRLDANNNEAGYLSLQYNVLGKIVGMNEMTGNSQILAEVEYSNINMEEVMVRYTYTGRDYTPNYYMQFQYGNMVKSAYTVPSHNNELVDYRYDLNINPYYHLNWPDLYLSNSSKNNTMYRVQMASGHTVGVLPYEYNYTYDTDGYPKEVITKYKSDLTGQYAYTTKTVLTYN